METEGSSKVCVTGGAGYIGSALVHSLLQKGYTVHATLRNLGDESKVGLLKSFPCAEERLHLFEADIYRPEEFEEAIHGCVFVFHVATPLQHTSGHKYNNPVEAAINAVKKIIDACIQSRTVKRLIYTASVVAASPLKDDKGGYKVTMDESCWTPLHLNVPYEDEQLKDYTNSKTKSEQVMLKFGEEKENELEVLRRIVREIPIVHIVDICRAHIFCAETPSVNGRFLCASSYVTSAEIAKYYKKIYPQLNQELLEELGREIKWGSKKMEDKGFAYKYSTEMILNDCLECAKKSGII